MDRGSFLKSLAVLFAAPSLIGNIGVAPVPANVNAFYFKITKEMQKDVVGMESFMTNYVYRKCKQYSIDINKPFEYSIYPNKDDFNKNLITCVITQPCT